MNNELQQLLDFIPQIVQLSRFENETTRLAISEKFIKAQYQILKDIEAGSVVAKGVGKALPTNEMAHYTSIADRFSKDDINPYWQHLKEEYDRILLNHQKDIAVKNISKKNKLKKVKREQRYS